MGIKPKAFLVLWVLLLAPFSYADSPDFSKIVGPKARTIESFEVLPGKPNPIGAFVVFDPDKNIYSLVVTQDEKTAVLDQKSLGNLYQKIRDYRMFGGFFSTSFGGLYGVVGLNVDDDRIFLSANRGLKIFSSRSTLKNLNSIEFKNLEDLKILMSKAVDRIEALAQTKILPQDPDEALIIYPLDEAEDPVITLEILSVKKTASMQNVPMHVARYRVSNKGGEPLTLTTEGLMNTPGYEPWVSTGHVASIPWGQRGEDQMELVPGKPFEGELLFSYSHPMDSMAANLRLQTFKSFRLGFYRKGYEKPVWSNRITVASTYQREGLNITLDFKGISSPGVYSFHARLANSGSESIHLFKPNGKLNWSGEGQDGPFYFSMGSIMGVYTSVDSITIEPGQSAEDDFLINGSVVRRPVMDMGLGQPEYETSKACIQLTVLSADTRSQYGSEPILIPIE